ncbi:leucine-rich repeat-containing protein 18 [Megalops cyprinoides]|uniref:leucine-rich repeat-containing protein 18 n=1 Tax=Megalops cyprinoides TaxID=118141 RepID=UPI0018648DF9|nr:leucine-rich repeat-containing protein 18 [Megalops cyprinoides]
MAVGRKKGAPKVKITLKMAKNALRVTADGRQRLDLSKLGLDAFPKCILKLANVDELDLSRNRLRTLPDCIERFANLRRLDLHSNRIERLPDAIGRLQSLRHLNLCDNRLSADGVPAAVAGLTELRSLNLGMNRLESVPPAVLGLAELRELGLFDNLLRGLPEGLAGLPHLCRVNAARNPVAAPHAGSCAQGADPASRPERLYLPDEGDLCKPCLQKCREATAKLHGRGHTDAIRRPDFSRLSTPNSVAWETQAVWRMKTPAQGDRR